MAAIIILEADLAARRLVADLMVAALAGAFLFRLYKRSR